MRSFITSNTDAPLDTGVESRRRSCLGLPSPLPGNSELDRHQLMQLPLKPRASHITYQKVKQSMQRWNPNPGFLELSNCERPHDP